MKHKILLISTLTGAILFAFTVDHIMFPSTVRRGYRSQELEYVVIAGVEIPLNEYTEEMRIDGTQALMITPFGKPGGTRISVRYVTLPDGNSLAVIDSLRIKSTIRQKAKVPVRAGWLPFGRKPNCVGPREIEVGSEQLMATHMVEIQRGAKNGAVFRRMEWRSPDLGCVTFQIEVQKLGGSLPTWNTVRGLRLMSLASFTDDPRMFDLATSYREVKPSELRQQFFMASGVANTDCPSCFSTDEGGDELYRRLH